MKPRERVFSALYLEEPDRVPMWEAAVNATVAEKIVGRKYPPIQANPPWPETFKIDRDKMVKLSVEGHILCYKKLHFDILSIFPSPPKDFKPTLPKENVIIDEWGATYRYIPETDQAFVIDHPIKAPEDLEKYYFPDPNADGRTDIPEIAVKMAEKEDLAVSCWLPGLCEFTVANLMGLRSFALFLHKYPNLLEKILNSLTIFIIKLGKALIDVGVEVLWFGNDTANRNGPFLPPRLHKKFFVPRLKKSVDSFHRKGAKVIQHSDGKVDMLMEDWLFIGVDAIHPFEPQAEMDIAQIKRSYGDKVCIMGNIDVSHTLPFGSKDDVRNEVIEKIKACAPNGGYVLTSSNSIFKAIPVENVMTMVKTCLSYGIYPHK